MIGDPEIWPDDDYEKPRKDDLASDVLDAEEYARWVRETGRNR